MFEGSFDVMPDWLTEATGQGRARGRRRVHSTTWYLQIVTLEGTVTASPGDFIIRGVQGELYRCKPDIFAATYEAVDQAGVRVLAGGFPDVEPEADGDRPPRAFGRTSMTDQRHEAADRRRGGIGAEASPSSSDMRLPFAAMQSDGEHACVIGPGDEILVECVHGPADAQFRLAQRIAASFNRDLENVQRGAVELLLAGIKPQVMGSLTFLVTAEKQAKSNA
jgi:hypothetical protein